ALRLIGYPVDDLEATIRSYRMRFRGDTASALDEEDLRILHALTWRRPEEQAQAAAAPCGAGAPALAPGWRLPHQRAVALAPPPDIVLDRLSTPVAWTDAAARIEGCNAAFARWLGVSPRRLLDQPLAALEAEGDVLRRALAAGDGGGS